MRVLVGVGCLLSLLVASGSPVLATVVSVDLPDLVMDLTYMSSQPGAPFYTGIQFASIDQVRLVLAGSVTPGLAPGPSGPELLPLAAGVGITNGQEGAWLTTPFIGSGPFTDTSAFTAANGWNFLLGGTGVVSMNAVGIGYHPSPAGAPEAGYYDGHMDITSARLEIEGTLAPEPATLSLLALGGLLLARRRRA